MADGNRSRNAPEQNSWSMNAQYRSKFYVPFDAEKQNPWDDWTWSFPIEDKSKAGTIEYVEYTSKSNGYVYVTHHNVLFSCCNDSIGVDLLQDENRIIVVEREAFNCNCICPFDVSFEIGPFIPGSYNTITIRKRFNLSEEGTVETYGSFSFKYPSSGKTRIKYEYE